MNRQIFLLNLENHFFKHISYLGIFILFMPIFFAGCSKDNDSVSTTSKPSTNPVPTVKIAQPLIQEITDWDEYTGRIEAVNQVEIRARVSGYLENVHFTAGGKVKKGDLLFSIDPRPFKAQLNYAVSELERTKSKYELAKNDAQRAENLLKEKAISIEEHDTRHKLLQETQATVNSAEANVYAAQLNLEFTQIKSPISGRISRELVTIGNLVNAGGSATLLATIVSTDPVYVYVDADEKSILKYRRHAQQHGKNTSDLKGTNVELAIADETTFLHQGKLDYIAPSENSASGTVTLRGVFANHDELLSPGFFARMRVRGDAAYSATLLPEKLIQTDQAQRFVWVVNLENKQVEYRQIGLGRQVGDFRVVNEGLKPNDWIVIEGEQKLKAGITVNAEKSALTQPKLGNPS